jgi:tetratricopeptide (TPR) repeat protein
MMIRPANAMFQRVAIGLLVVALCAAAATAAQRAGLWGDHPTLSPGTNSGTSRASTADLGQQITTTQNYLHTHPDDADALTQLGQLYMQRAREIGDPAYYPRAEEAFMSVYNRDGKNVSALAGLGTVALARHQFLEALDWGTRARDLSPQAAFAYGIIADAQIELGRYPEAVDTIQQMVDLRPDLNSYARVSYARELYGQIPAAIDAMEKAVAAGGPGLESTAWTLVQLGTLHFNSGDLDTAEADYNRSLQEWPNYLHALAGLGRVEAARGHYQAAIDYCKRATATIPLPEYVIALGDVYSVAGQPDAAQDQYALARVQTKLFAANGTNTDLELSLFATDHPQPGEDPAQNVALAQAALTARPGIHGHDALAWALYRAGDYDGAQREITAAMALGTQDALLYFHAGAIAQARGDTTAAQTNFATALKINPYFSLIHAPEARAALGR